VLRALLGWMCNPCPLDAVTWAQHHVQGDVASEEKSAAREGLSHPNDAFYTGFSLFLPILLLFEHMKRQGKTSLFSVSHGEQILN